jgi:hypothetical protein
MKIKEGNGVRPRFSDSIAEPFKDWWPSIGCVQCQMERMKKIPKWKHPKTQTAERRERRARVTQKLCQ